MRRKKRGASGEIGWVPSTGEVEREKFGGVDAVVHLAGESIAARWTPEKKDRIRDSRVLATRRLAMTLAGLPRPPRTLVCAWAISFYGDRGAMPLDETAEMGRGFLAEVCRDWEAAAQPAARRRYPGGPRPVRHRAQPERRSIGAGSAALSPRARRTCRHRRAVLELDLDRRRGGALHTALMDEALVGPMNVTAPEPVTNSQFTTTLAGIVHRPSIFPLPAGALKKFFGQMADEMLLSGAGTSQAARSRRVPVSASAARYGIAVLAGLSLASPCSRLPTAASHPATARRLWRRFCSCGPSGPRLRCRPGFHELAAGCQADVAPALRAHPRLRPPRSRAADARVASGLLQAGRLRRHAGDRERSGVRHVRSG